MVEVVAYRDEWPELYELEAARIGLALRGLEPSIEHVGSTAVPGLAAKAFIDIQVSLSKLEPTVAFREPLAGLGYSVGKQDPDDPDWWFFEREADGPARGYHVHVVPAGSEGERRTLAFRDELRRNADVALAYESLKRDLAERFANDVMSYTEAKTPFIREVEARTLGRG